MTYCVAMQVNEGIAFLSDSRTNAGVDRLSTYSKMFTFGRPKERVVVVLTAGNLATTQAVIKHIRKDIEEDDDSSILNLGAMDDIAAYIGKLNFDQQGKHVGQAAGNGPDVSASFIAGGQIGKAEPELYLVYPEGNYIAATVQTPFQQIGEVKYGKPILDRMISPDTPLSQAALCGMVSMDSTMRSNATVGPPIEMLLYRKGNLEINERRSFDVDDPYLMDLRRAWERELTRSFQALPPL